MFKALVPAQWFTLARQAAACDWALLRRYPKLAWSAFGAMLVPALYVLIVLSSVWDPTARLSKLPVALVNQDAGLRMGPLEVNLGAEVLQALRTQGRFGYVEFRDVEDARRGVREGRLAFALLLPTDFSHRAVLGAQPGAGRLGFYLSEGNNYAAAGFARRLAPELAHQVNEMLNERRWTGVLDTTAGSQRDLASLRQGVDRLVEGAERATAAARQARLGGDALLLGLADARDGGLRLQVATAQLAEGAAQVGGGLRPLGDGLRAMAARTVSEHEVQALRQGGLALLQGHAELGAGLNRLLAGTETLRDGVVSFRQEVGELPFVGERLDEAASALQAGAGQLALGLDLARGAQGRLADGTQVLIAGADQLAEGLSRQTAAIRQMAEHLPDDARTERFTAGAAEAAAGSAALASGLRQLHDGQARLQRGLVQLADGGAGLAGGLRQLQASLPAGKPSPAGTPAGLANSVQPVLEVVAPVTSEGAGFAPNFVPLALWMGAVMTGFLFHFGRLPAPLMAAPRLATVAGRLVCPALVVSGQALVMLVMLVQVMHVPVQRMMPFAITLLAASLLFLSLIFTLLHLFGDVGKIVAVLLLAVQMSAAGAMLPIELTPPFFQTMHQWLPLTWVVHAFRASLFGAYGGEWVGAWAAMLATGTVALALAMVFGRWRAVPVEAYRSTMEVD